MKKKIGKIISGILVASVCCVTSIAFGVAALNETHITAKAESVHAAVNVFEPTTKTDEAPQNGLYASMAMNDIPYYPNWDVWYGAATSIEQCIFTSKGVNTPFYGGLCKYGASDWYVTFNTKSEANPGFFNKGESLPTDGDVMTVGGLFGNADKNYYFELENAQFEYQNGTWVNITPTITVKANETDVSEEQIIFVRPNTAASDIVATSTSGDVSINYDEGALQEGKFVLRDGETSSDYRVTFTVSKDLGKTVNFNKYMTVRVGYHDFVMEEGAAVRVSGSTANGLRFIAEMSEAVYSDFEARNATYGMVIIPKDYITEGYELTAENLFGQNAKYSETVEAGVSQAVRKMLHLKELTPTNCDEDGNYEIRGAITDLYVNNITREFVGVAYAKVGEQYVLAGYYGDNVENNSRSMYYVSQKAIDKNDNTSAVQTAYIDKYAQYLEDKNVSYNRTYTVNYIRTANGKSTVETETRTAPLNSEINLTAKEISGFTLASASTITSKVYANKDNVFNFYYTVEGATVYDNMAWYYPTLDASNNYDNAKNDAVAQKMKNAGFTTVLLGDVVALQSKENIEITGMIIDMFYRNGLKSVVWTGNWSDTEEYAYDTLPNFSNHEGFAGFFTWDEPAPTTDAMNAVAEYADWYMNVYGEDAAPFMVTLLPSYAEFNGDYTSYPTYVEAYCDIVLSKFNDTEHTKYLSVDSYPIKADGALRDTFLYDWAVLKTYALQYGAEMHAVLQGCGFEDESNGTTYNKAPTEEQMRLQLYTALAFGADSISWWCYEPLEGVTAAAGKDTQVYNDIKMVNSELATFGSLYKNYDWKGVIMSEPYKGEWDISSWGYKNQDPQYNAFNKVQSESLFKEYLLSASNTSSFSSITGSGSNHIVSVMKDADGNEAFVAVNYAAVQDNQTLSLTLKGKLDGAQFAVYKNGEMQTVTIGTSGYTLTLAPGEGAFIVEANSAHTVTFKNWDGSVLQEETLTFGSIPEYRGETPTRENHKFVGWTQGISAISGDTVYTALFEELPKYTITFRNDDESVISSEQYYQGATVVEPATPTKAPVEGECSYVFAGWDYPVTTVGCDATYRATYTKTDIVDFFSCDFENSGIDSITNNTETKSENSAYSLHIVEPISSNNLPCFALTLDKTYDLTNSYMVFDTTINKDGWAVVFDFVNNSGRLGLWNMLTLKSGTSAVTYYCEDLGNGWIRVYVDVDLLYGALNNVSKIYCTLNASDGSGELNFNFDNLHFEKKDSIPTEADDASAACGLIVVNKGTMTVDTSVYSVFSTQSIKANVPAGNSGVWWNYDLDLTKITGSALNMSGKTITFDVKIVGNMKWVGFTVADGNDTYAQVNGENYAWMNSDGLSDGWSGFGMSITSIANGWYRVSFNPDTSFSSASSNLAKLRFLVTLEDANEASMYVDNLYVDSVITLPTEADDASAACGLIVVNKGTMTVDTSVYSVFSTQSIKANVPAGNSGVWWNYDLDLTKITGSALNMSGKTITFDVKIVGNMTWVGFTVADGNGTYAQVNGENYAWMNSNGLSDGWSGYGMSIVSLNDGWYRVSFNPDTSFSSAGSNITKLRFLVNPKDANEASMYVDNLYLDSVITLPTEADDASSACGLSPVNGGTMTVDTSVYSTFSTQSIKANVPAGNSGSYLNYDLDLTSYFGSAMNMSGKTITFDVKIVGNMKWVGFTVADGNGTYQQVNGEGYAWMNLSSGWSGYGMSIVSLNEGWYRVSFNPDASFSSAGSNIAKLRFLVNPQDGNEASMYIDNLYLANCLPTDYIGQCGLVAVNGGSIAKDTEVVSKLSTESVKCTIPAGNNDAWWNYDISLREIADGKHDLSGQTISFDMKIVGSMGWAGFAISADGNTYSGYAYTNLTDGWSGYGISVKAIGDGWMRCTVTLDTNFSAYSSAVGVLRFMVHPTDNNQSVMYLDNLYLG